MNRIHDEFAREIAERLGQFQAEWAGGAVPNIIDYLAGSFQSDTSYVNELIEMDLEYRWRQHQPTAAHDVHGFPMLANVEDYVALLNEEQRLHLNLPQLVATEYFVRIRYGDRPDKQSFIDRFPDDPSAIEAALNSVPLAAELQESTDAVDGPSKSFNDESTFDFRRSNLDGNSPVIGGRQRPQQIGKYRLETLAGTGGFGEVWKAYDSTLKRDVAIKIPRADKVFPAKILREFQKEAEKIAMLGRIPGIVTVFDCGHDDGQPYIVSDFIEGASLDRQLKLGKMPYDRSAELIATVAATLHQAHIKHLIHRDIKPSNILIDTDGNPIITDFGVAVTEEEQLQEGHSTKGTFAYMAPEQAKGESHRTDGRADIYALGVVLYRMLTGRLPFVGDSPAEYIDQILHREPRPLRSIDDQIPSELERICLKCLKKPISERYTTAGDLAHDLRNWDKVRSGRPRATTLTIVAAALTLAAAAFFLRPSRPQDSNANQAAETASEFVITPTNILSAGSSQNDMLRVNEISNTLQLVSENLYLVKLGRIDNTDCIIRVKIKPISGDGEAGIFLGFRELKDGNRRQIQLIRLMRESDGGIYSRRTIQSFHADTPYSRNSTEFQNIPYDSDSQANTVEVHLSGGKLRKVHWNGEPIENVKPQLLDTPQTLDATGLFGVYTNKAAAVFSQLEIDQQKPLLKNGDVEN